MPPSTSAKPQPSSTVIPEPANPPAIISHPVRTPSEILEFLTGLPSEDVADVGYQVNLESEGIVYLTPKGELDFTRDEMTYSILVQTNVFPSE